MADGIEPVQSRIDGRLVHRCVGGVRIDDLTGLDRGGTAKDHKVDKRVGPQTVRTMHTGTACLAHGHQTRHDSVGIFLRRVQHLAPVVRGNTAHIVVHGRQHGDRLFRQIHASKDAGGFTDAGQAQVQRLGRQVVQVQVDVIAFWPHAAPLADFHCHATADHVARRKILVGRRIALHESLAFGVGQVSPPAPEPPSVIRQPAP